MALNPKLVFILYISLCVPPVHLNSIFTQGDILHQIQTSQIFLNSKVFVDHTLKTDSSKIVENFGLLNLSSDTKKSLLLQFVTDHFVNDTGVVKTGPVDWSRELRLLRRISRKKAKQFARNLNEKLLKYSRQVEQHVKRNQSLYSILYLPRPYISAGANHEELLYWDSYWTIKGLLAVGMFQSVKHTIENLVYLCAQHLYVPEGSRVYYLNRPGFPLLAPMLLEYAEKTNDWKFVEKNWPALVVEFSYWFWLKISIAWSPFDIFVFPFIETRKAQCRPEYYLEDLNEIDFQPIKSKDSDLNPTVKRQYLLWSWIPRSSSKRTLRIDLKLLTLLEWYARSMMTLADYLNNVKSYGIYKNYTDALQKPLNKLLLQDEFNIWGNYHIENGQEHEFSPWVVGPIWTGMSRGDDRVVEYLERQGAYLWAGGVPENTQDFISKASAVAQVVIALRNINTDTVMTTAEGTIIKIPDCSKVINELRECQKLYNIYYRILGHCSEITTVVNKCLKNQREAKRKINAEESKRRIEKQTVYLKINKRKTNS